MDDRRFRVFVLGAGFSRLAGFPLGPGLWTQVLARLDADLGKDNSVRRDLEIFRGYKRDLSGQEIAVDEVDFEEFISFLDVEHYLGLRGSDTLGQEGNESQITVKWYIGKVLCEHFVALKNVPMPYLRFAQSLRPRSDIVLTFNYDSLLERSLELASQPYRLFPERYSRIGVTMNEIDESKDEIIVLKVHGSADWFNRSSYDERMEIAAGTAAWAGTYVPRDPVFGPDRIVEPIPLVDGPRHSDDPLRKIHRVLDPSPLYVGSYPKAVPFILSPSYSKILYASPLLGFWNGLGKSASWHLGMAIVGFSLPSHDEYVRQALYSLTRGYTDNWWNEEIIGKRKLPLRIVDLRTGEKDQQSLRERYRFVDWSRTEAFFQGFSEEAVEFLFRE